MRKRSIFHFTLFTAVICAIAVFACIYSDPLLAAVLAPGVHAGGIFAHAAMDPGTLVAVSASLGGISVHRPATHSSAFQTAIAGLADMTPAERGALAAALSAYDVKAADTTIAYPTVLGVGGGLTFYSDGSTLPDAFAAYFGSVGDVKGVVINNYFWSDTAERAAEAGISLSQEALDNIAYNQSTTHSPLMEGMANGEVNDMLQGFSAKLVDGRFDRHSVTALPYAAASPHASSSADAIVAKWQSLGNYVPTVLERTWTVV